MLDLSLGCAQMEPILLLDRSLRWTFFILEKQMMEKRLDWNLWQALDTLFMSSLVRCPGSKSLDVGAPTCPVFVNGKIKGSGGWWDDMIWNDNEWYDMIWYDMIWYDMIWYDCWLFFLFLFSFYHMICSGSGSQAYFPCPANMLLIEVGGWLLELDRGLFTCENDCIRLSITSQKHSKTTWLA